MPVDPFEMLHAGPLKLADVSLGTGDLAVRKVLLHQTFETWLVPRLPESRVHLKDTMKTQSERK